MLRSSRKHSDQTNQVTTDGQPSNWHPENYNKNKKAKSKRSFPTSLLLLITVTLFMSGWFVIYGKSKEKNVGGRSITSLTVPQIQREFRDTEHKSNNQDAVIVEEMDPVGNLKVKRDPPSSHSFPEPPEFDTDGKTRLHMVFSTDCSAYQHWQSYLLFYSALKVGQPGRVTRIASGCSDEESAKAKAWHEEHVKNSMSDRFGLHFAPHFSSVMKDGAKVRQYKYFNKPFGLLHWLEHGEKMGVDPSTGKLIDEDVVVILIDPDMILLRPIGADFSNKREVLYLPQGAEGRKFRVDHGSPFAQKYGLGTNWRKFNLTTIAGEESPSKIVEKEFARDHFTVGPPYIATGKDTYNIARKWSEFAPRVYAEYPHLLAEMYAYIIAAAHVELPHQIIKSTMVSNVAAMEAWPFVDKIPEEKVCEFASDLDHIKYAVPNVIHYCQNFAIGEWSFGKHRIPLDFFTCESPLLAIPHVDLGKNYPKPGKPKENLSQRHATRITFVVCVMISVMNEAGTFFKQNHCREAKMLNTQKTLRIS